MTEEIDYSLLFNMVRYVIENKGEMIASCVCKDCKYMKRATIYFKMLKSNVNNDEQFSRICILLTDEEEWFVYSFIHSILVCINEDNTMASLFDDKESMTDDTYKFRCDVLMNVKRFKKMYEKQKN